MTRVLLLLLLGAFASHTALAHHSFAANFDTARNVEIEGTITSVTWRNPHVGMTVLVDEGTAAEKTWTIESHSLSNLDRMNVGEGVLAIGSTVKIAGMPARRRTESLFMLHLLTPEGREVLFQAGLKPLWTSDVIGTDDVLFARFEEGDPADRPTTIFAVWTTNYADPDSWPVFPRTSENYPLTEAAKTKMAGFDLDRDDPLKNCTPKGMPSAMAQPYPIQLIDDGERIVLKIEEYDAVREIHLAEKHNDSAVEPSNLGYSTGRWDGDTLKVTTTKISFPFFDVLALPIFVPQSAAVHVDETFRLREDGNYLDYTMTVTDPATLTKPVAFKKYWKWNPDAVLQAFACDDA